MVIYFYCKKIEDFKYYVSDFVNFIDNFYQLERDIIGELIYYCEDYNYFFKCIIFCFCEGYILGIDL